MDKSASQAVYHDGRPPPVRRNPARRAQPPPWRHLLNAAGGRPSQVLGCGLARLPPGVSVMFQRYQSPECAREAGQMSESAVNDRSTRRGAELLHKDSSGAASAGCPGFPPSGLALPSRYRARTPAARHVLKDERAAADHIGWSALSSQLCGGWASGAVLWAHPCVSGCGSSVVDG